MRVKVVAPVAAVTLAVLGSAAWLALRPGAEAERVLAASGTVEATEADLGFQAGGRIREIAVREGDAVGAGALLARLDAAELEAYVAAAEARLAAARSLLAELEHGARPEELEQARAVANAARRRLEDAERTLRRARVLYDAGATSLESLDLAETAHVVAEAEFDRAREALELVESGPRPERIEAQRAAVRQAEAALRQATAALANAEIHAPFAGVVTVRHREPGEAVSPGLPVLTVMDMGDRWVRIYVREDRVGAVRIGQPARITADTYPDRVYRGEVVFIASEAEFTPRNVQTTEERVKLVYAVKVRITGDASHELKPGVPADVVLEADPHAWTEDE